jgi:hypothetical protein
MLVSVCVCVCVCVCVRARVCACVYVHVCVGWLCCNHRDEISFTLACCVCAYREAVILLRKVTIVAITVFVSDEFFQVYISGIVIVLFLVAHVVVKPFARPLKPTPATLSAQNINVSAVLAVALPP